LKIDIHAPGLRAVSRGCALAFFLALADQATKYAILVSFAPGERYFVTRFFNLTLVYNPGAAFSLLAGAGAWTKWLFMALAFAVSAWILHTIAHAPRKTGQNLALTLILSGALGNVIDRIFRGVVVDFLDLHLAQWHWPTFNLADICITCGAALLILEAWLDIRRARDEHPGAEPMPPANEGDQALSVQGENCRSRESPSVEMPSVEMPSAEMPSAGHTPS
jgi:signal peptidase II